MDSKIEKLEDIQQEQEKALEDLNVLGQLTGAQYWEWRCSLEEITSSKNAAANSALQLKIFELEVNVGKLKCELFKTSVKAAQDNAARIEADYHTFREKLETELGFPIKDCTIDPYNYKVRKL